MFFLFLLVPCIFSNYFIHFLVFPFILAASYTLLLHKFVLLCDCPSADSPSRLDPHKNENSQFNFSTSECRNVVKYRFDEFNLFYIVLLSHSGHHQSKTLEPSTTCKTLKARACPSKV